MKVVAVPTETLYVNAHYISTIISVVERKMLKVLSKLISRPEMCQISFDEESYVFTSSVRQQIYPSSRLDPFPDLADIPQSQIDKAIT